MTRHIVARTTDIPPGGNKVVTLDGRDVVVFHANGEFFALLNRCPHSGAPLDQAACVARLTSPEPGVYQRSRVGELLRCAWHGWEFDMRNGQSGFDPKRVKVRTYPVVIEDGETLAKGPYVAETFQVHVEDLRDRRDLTLLLARPDGDAIRPLSAVRTGSSRCQNSRCGRRPSA